MFERTQLRYSRGIVDPRLVLQSGFMTKVGFNCVQGNSIDLTVGEVYEVRGEVTLDRNGKRELPFYFPVIPKDDYFTLELGEVYQIEFQQRVKLPHYLCGITFVRSSLAKSGTSGENGLFDSGYEGGLGMMLTVRNPLHIQVGSPIAQVVFFKSNAKGREYSGYYSNRRSPNEWNNQINNVP